MIAVSKWTIKEVVIHFVIVLLERIRLQMSLTIPSSELKLLAVLARQYALMIPA